MQSAECEMWEEWAAKILAKKNTLAEPSASAFQPSPPGAGGEGAFCFISATASLGEALCPMNAIKTPRHTYIYSENVSGKGRFLYNFETRMSPWGFSTWAQWSLGEAKSNAFSEARGI